jgi:integral membrane protein
MSLLKSEIGRLRIIAFIEGTSFLLILFVTMPLKYWLEIPEPNKIIGMLHGVLFMLYILAVIQVRSTYNWDRKTTFWSLLASIIPFGTFWVDRKYFVKY